MKKQSESNAFSVKQDDSISFSKLIDIIIPVFNAQEDVEKCLNSILSQNTSNIKSIIIVNDASDDITTRYLNRVCVDNEFIRVIKNVKNLGYTKSINRGIEFSTADYLMLLNSDTVVSQGWLFKLLQCVSSDGKIGLVGPVSNAATWQSIPLVKNEKGQFSVNSLPVNFTLDEFSLRVTQLSSKRYPKVPVLNGFCLLIKKEVISTIGMMDEVNFPVGFGEENDFCIRARNAGFDLVIADDCYIYHAKSKSFGRERRDQLSRKGSLRLKNKHGESKVQELSDLMHSNATLKILREKVSTVYYERQDKESDKNLKVIFLLPTPSDGGGSHSIVQEARAMKSLGVDAIVAIKQEYLADARRRYKDMGDEGGNLFVTYDYSSMLRIVKTFDVVVATIFTSVHNLKKIKMMYPHILLAYYIQDYEPMFFEKKSKGWNEAARTYDLISNMLRFAKTDWIIDQVERRNKVGVEKVVPSIDHDIYYSKKLRINKACISLIAMIRPQTPRRGAKRTMELLSKIKKEFENRVDIHIFGCDGESRDFQSLPRDFEFTNHGILNRSKVAQCLRESDIFIDLSDYQAFGRTSLEAMACGCASMLPFEGGGNEYAIGNYNAIVVDTRNIQECYEKLKGLILSGEKLVLLKKQGLETVKKYSPEKAAQSELLVIQRYLMKHREQFPVDFDYPVIFKIRNNILLFLTNNALFNIDSRFRRLLRKLIDNPQGYFLDSKNPLLRMLSRFFSGTSE